MGDRDPSIVEQYKRYRARRSVAESAAIANADKLCELWRHSWKTAFGNLQSDYFDSVLAANGFRTQIELLSAWGKSATVVNHFRSGKSWNLPKACSFYLSFAAPYQIPHWTFEDRLALANMKTMSELGRFLEGEGPETIDRGDYELCVWADKTPAFRLAFENGDRERLKLFSDEFLDHMVMAIRMPSTRVVYTPESVVETYALLGGIWQSIKQHIASQE